MGSAARLHGIVGQILNAGTNVATSYVASLLLVPQDFGRFVVAFGCVTVSLGAGRGLIGSAMLVHLPSASSTERERLVSSALSFTAIVGLAVAAAVAALGIWSPVLWWFAPWVVVALLHDVARYIYLSTERPGHALALDVTWAGTQVAVVVVGATVAGAVSLGLLATAWGLGALGGVLLFVLLHGARLSHPASWMRATRDVAGWFTAAAVISQVELYLVLLLSGALLGTVEVGGLRALQLMTYQPALVLLGSMLTILQPAVVRAAATPGRLPSARTRITVAVSPVVAGLLLVALLRDPLVGLLFPRYEAFAALAVPLAVQSAVVAWGIAPLAVLNGLRRGAIAFRVQAYRLVGVGVGVLVGAHLAGLEGVAWALVFVNVLVWLRLRQAASTAIAWHDAELAAATSGDGGRAVTSPDGTSSG